MIYHLDCSSTAQDTTQPAACDSDLPVCFRVSVFPGDLDGDIQLAQKFPGSPPEGHVLFAQADSVRQAVSDAETREPMRGSCALSKGRKGLLSPGALLRLGTLGCVSAGKREKCHWHSAVAVCGALSGAQGVAPGSGSVRRAGGS